MPTTGGWTIVRYSGTRGTTEGMKSVTRIAPLSSGAYLGRRIKSAYPKSRGEDGRGNQELKPLISLV